MFERLTAMPITRRLGGHLDDHVGKFVDRTKIQFFPTTLLRKSINTTFAPARQKCGGNAGNMSSQDLSLL